MTCDYVTVMSCQNRNPSFLDRKEKKNQKENQKKLGSKLHKSDSIGQKYEIWLFFLGYIEIIYSIFQYLFLFTDIFLPL